MSTETQGSSVLDKDPVKTRMRSENFDAGGYWPFHFYCETEGPVYGVEPIRTFTGVASFDIKLIDLQPNLQDIQINFSNWRTSGSVTRGIYLQFHELLITPHT